MAKEVKRTATITLPDGTKKRIYARGATEKEALRNLAKLEAEYKSGKMVINSNTNFDQWAEECLTIYKAAEVTPATLNNHKRIIRLCFSPSIGNLPISAITPAHIQACLNTQTGKSANHIKKCYNTINFIMQKAKISRLTHENPVEYVTIPKGNQAQHRRALSTAERILFLQAADRIKNGTIFLVSYYCGLRPGEARALMWKNIDLEKETITVTNTIEQGTDKLTVPKSKAGYRTIPIPDRLLPYLRQLPKGGEDDFIFTGSKDLFAYRRYRRSWIALHNQMNKLNGAKTYRNQIIKSTIDENITPYYLRHTYCTILAEKNIPLKTAQYLMGHSSIDMTANIYTHVTENLMDISKNIVKSI